MCCSKKVYHSIECPRSKKCVYKSRQDLSRRRKKKNFSFLFIIVWVCVCERISPKFYQIFSKKPDFCCSCCFCFGGYSTGNNNISIHVTFKSASRIYANFLTYLSQKISINKFQNFRSTGKENRGVVLKF